MRATGVVLPLGCVVDTNVAVTANGPHAGAGPECAAECGRVLVNISRNGRVFIDDAGLIVREYRDNLNARGQPGLGDAFLRWLLTNEWAGRRVVRVPLKARADDSSDFEELPPPTTGVFYDPSDRKFLAVAAAHPERPPILQATDSKWWGWQESLSKAGVKVHFLCPEIQAKFATKMEP